MSTAAAEASEVEVVHRAPGRPRSAQAEQAILDAALEMLAAVGINGLTVEGVAARAGVGKATIYRRYPSKGELILDALSRLSDEYKPVTGVSVRADLIQMVDAIRRRSASSLSGQIMPRLIGDSADNPELMEAYRERTLRPRRDIFVSVLQRGVDEGLVRDGLDLEDVIDLFVGPVFNRVLKCGADAAGGKEYSTFVVDTVLAGLKPVE